jgi:integrase
MNQVVTRAADFQTQMRVIESIGGDNYGYHVRDFTRWAMTNGEALNQQLIIDYFHTLNESTFSANTIRIKRQAVKARLRQLSEGRGLDSHFRDSLESFLRDLDRKTTTRAPKVNSRTVEKEKYLTKADIQKLLDNSRGIRQNLIIRFLWASGARVSEMIGIRLSDSQVLGDVVFIRLMGKGSKERYIKISTALFNEINHAMRGVQYLFETATGRQYQRTAVSDQLQKLTTRVLGKPFRAHSLRHSFATHKIKSGVPISYVSKYLGHSSVSITAAMYDHGSIETADLINDEI